MNILLRLLRPGIVLSALPLLLAWPTAAATYHVDCESGGDDRAGASAAEAWRSLGKVSATEFRPGDRILFRRNTRCEGQLWPKGSGAPGEPISIASYGTGPLPVIAAGTESAALRLFNQEHWHVSELELVGGDPYGLHVSGEGRTLRHFRIRDVVARDVGGVAKSKTSGLVVFGAGPGQIFEDIVIDGVTAYNTKQWAGIIVNGAPPRTKPNEPRSRNIAIRNSIVHDVYGDGIIVFQGGDAVIERSVAWNTGMEPRQTVGTPNAIWTWRCRRCVVQFTEGFFSDSPGVDGGVYDIDWGNDDNTVQFNYGHDSQAYCVAIFGAQKEVTTNSVVRYNVCANNGRSPRLARHHGEIMLYTWEGGSLDGVEIYNNTIYWDPPLDAEALVNEAVYSGSRPNWFRNNLIVSTTPLLARGNLSLLLNNNLYWFLGSGEPQWSYGGTTISSIERLRAKTEQESSGVYAAPGFRQAKPGRMLPAPFSLSAASPALKAGELIEGQPEHDYYGAPLAGGAPHIGAAQLAPGKDAPAVRKAPAFQLQDWKGNTRASKDLAGRWLLLAFLDADGEGDSRTQSVFLRSLAYQYRHQGLEIALALRDPASKELESKVANWRLEEMPVLVSASEAARAYGAKEFPALFLVCPDGMILRQWDGLAAPADLGLTVRSVLGPPRGTPAVATGGKLKRP